MIIRRLLHWVCTASARERAEATDALARAYLYCDLSSPDRGVAEDAMITLLGDPSPLVRRALAEVLAASPDAPYAVIHGLAFDHGDVAAAVLARSPLLIDADLVDLVATRDGTLQAVIAARVPLQRAVAAAIAEVGSAEACLAAIENPRADVAPSSIARIIDRFGHLGAIREALLARPDLSLAARQLLVRQLSGSLADFVADRGWLARDRAEDVSREACEKATVAIAALRLGEDARSLIRHLRNTGQLTASLMLRSLLSDNMAMFEDALTEQSGLPLRRVQALVRDGGDAGLRAVFDKAGLPAAAYVALRDVLTATREQHHNADFVAAGGLKRSMVERALTSCERCDLEDIEPLLILLRRFAAEAAREEARINCEQLVEEDRIKHDLAAA